MITAICSECGALGTYLNCYHGDPHEGGVVLCRKHAREADGLVYQSVPLGQLTEDPEDPSGMTWVKPPLTGEPS